MSLRHRARTPYIDDLCGMFLSLRYSVSSESNFVGFYD